MIPFIEKVVLSLALGGLVGLEREYSKKQELVGMRTFSLISVFACLSTVAEQIYALPYVVPISFVCTLFVGVSLLVGHYEKKVPVGLTTIMALFLSYVLGLLVGLGLYNEAIFAGIIITAILFERRPLRSFVKHLDDQEILDGLEFAVVVFIVYPLLPQEPLISGLFTLDLRLLWLLVVFVSLLNFFGFVFLRIEESARSMGLLGFLGGAVDTKATTGGLLNLFSKARDQKTLIASSFLVMNSAMFVRNLAVVSVFESHLFPQLAAFAFGLAALSLFYYVKSGSRVAEPDHKIKISSPFAVFPAIKLGVLVFATLLVLEAINNFIGAEAALVSAFLGGLVSSKAILVSIILLLETGGVSFASAQLMVVLAFFGSLTTNILLLGVSKNREMLNMVLVPQLITALAGFTLFLATSGF